MTYIIPFVLTLQCKLFRTTLKKYTTKRVFLLEVSKFPIPFASCAHSWNCLLLNYDLHANTIPIKINMQMAILLHFNTKSCQTNPNIFNGTTVCLGYTQALENPPRITPRMTVLDY